MTPGSRLPVAASRVVEPPVGRPTVPRTFALLSGLTLIAAFLGVFYRLVDVVGGVAWLAGAVAAAFLLSTALARLLPPRVALGVGVAMLAGGAGLYVLLVPEHHDRVLTVEFLVDFAAYLTGISVLQFLRVDLWAVAVAPGPTFLTWYLLLRRRYDLGSLVGGGMLGFFVLTGDAGWTTTVVGSTSALAVLGFGTLELAGGTGRHAERLGGVFVGTVLAARTLRGLDWGGGGASPGGSDGSAGVEGSGGSGGSGGTGGGPTLETSLTATDGRVDVVGPIGLSPAVRFTVTADRVGYWHAGALDRYTGRGWIRSGGAAPYEGPLDPPPAGTTTVEQTFRTEASVAVMPAAWKPVRVREAPAGSVRVTSTGALAPVDSLPAGRTYTVLSEVPDLDAGRLREAGTDYPPAVRERYLQLPASTPERVARRAREVAGGAATPYDAARAVGRWLQANRGYSLDVERPAGDVVDAFLFGMERGYCVHFATAMAVMLRSLGVPARFANGYTPGERVAEDRVVVRGLDAHAWTEVHFPGAGWIPFDPTPAGPRRAAERSRLEAARSAGAEGIDTEATRARADAATPAPENVSTVVTPDPLAAVEANLSSGTPSPVADERTTTAAGGENATADGADAVSPGWRLPDPLAEVDRVTLVAGLVGGVLGVRRLRLVEHAYRSVRLRHQSPTDSPADDVTRAFERLEILLSRRARPREPGETPRQYVDALGSPLDRRARRVVELYERANYSGTVSREAADEAIRCVDELVGERRSDRRRGR
jgi:transglutaminase-like putative cysteine protease